MKCQYCGAEEVLPFKCPYCNGYFCAEHRLPENHGCPEIWRATAPQEAAPRVTVESKSPYEYNITYGPRPTTRTFWFSHTEIKHLILSTILVTGVGFSIFLGSSFGSDILHPSILVGLSLVFVAIFLLHEIAHKLVAQHYGLWAEFRLTMFGALLTLISIISPFKIISPGAVMIAGQADKEIVGKTAVAGPATNLVLSTVSFALYELVRYANFSKAISTIALVSLAFNAWIALFNLIPIGILDGWKVLSWNKIVWAVAFTTSVALTIFTLPFLGL